MLAIIETSAKRREPAYTSKKTEEEEEKEEAHSPARIYAYSLSK